MFEIRHLRSWTIESSQVACVDSLKRFAFFWEQIQAVNIGRVDMQVSKIQMNSAIGVV